VLELQVYLCLCGVLITVLACYGHKILSQARCEHTSASNYRSNAEVVHCWWYIGGHDTAEQTRSHQKGADYGNVASAGSGTEEGGPTLQKSSRRRRLFLSRYSDTPWAGLPGFDSLQWTIFLSSIASRPTLRSIHPPIQWIPWTISPGDKAAGAGSRPLISICCRG
jgi:hypothetical protein